jgi:hypothetical protein
MQRRSTLLAKSNNRRYVAHDRAGVIHLCWDNIAVCLGLTEFTRIVRLLENGVVELNLTQIADGNYCLRQKKLGHFQLTLLDTGLYLTLADFLKLVKLARAAARQLRTQAINFH